ncbi:hypothetical protein K0M31_011253 [Melipona bicolor]|uniref:Uncharacterized protein n=1 Tax=Melipona bicolor TaxID=60889 RepID=A0AA40KUG1_9HYME|nr:hypothetical protein K0M31_011253 [Melipona bicolor]
MFYRSRLWPTKANKGQQQQQLLGHWLPPEQRNCPWNSAQQLAHYRTGKQRDRVGRTVKRLPPFALRQRDEFREFPARAVDILINYQMKLNIACMYVCAYVSSGVNARDNFQNKYSVVELKVDATLSTKLRRLNARGATPATSE